MPRNTSIELPLSAGRRAAAGRPDAGPARPCPADLLAGLVELRDEMLRMEEDGFDLAGVTHPSWTASATNLLHYLALRRRDLRAEQEGLAVLGLSSLGRSESHVLANLDAVIDALQRIAGASAARRTAAQRDAPTYDGGARLLAEHSEALLGAAPAERSVRILVTLPTEAADDVSLVHDLVASGMDCVRINCAHDDESVWTRMIANLRRAERDVGRPCRVLMDLGGPKLRTGPTVPGPGVVKWKPERNQLGRVVAPVRVWLHDGGAGARSPALADASIPVDAAWLEALHDGDSVSFDDARGAERRLADIRRVPGGAWAQCRNTAYVVAGTRLTTDRAAAEPRHGTVGPLPPLEDPVRVAPGDFLVVTTSGALGCPRECGESGAVLSPASVSCTLPEVIADVRPGERIFFDDGRIGGVVREVAPERILVEITQARAGGDKIRPDSGINLPDTDISIAAMTAKDAEDLAFVARNADAVSLSFVRSAADVEALAARLAELGRPDLGVVLKIETREGFERLPELLLTAMKNAPVGVMIARGDLAVECGYERLAEIQEEILWFCEAAHVPAIWATQVLESLAKDGRPSRAEITDAAMAVRAECVMLNKGPHVVAAVRTLDDILRRMAAHQHKKSAMFRPLGLARDFGSER